MKQRRATYRLHLTAADGSWTPGGAYPSRDLAEAVGDALKAAGACSCYDVEMED